MFKFSFSRRFFAAALLVLLIALCLNGPLFAQNSGEEFSTDQLLQKGMIVVKKDATKVEAVTKTTSLQTYGLVIEVKSTSPDATTDVQKVVVANTGSATVLVSDQAGAIRSGDYVTVSDLAGIGMRADTEDVMVVGKAVDSFDGQSGVVNRAELKEGDSTRVVNLGHVTVDIGIAANPLSGVAPGNIPGVLKKITTNVAQKPISSARAYFALIVFIITALISAVVLYSGVRSSITSIGRNPLSKTSIMHGLWQTIFTSLAVFIVGLFGVYLLLKL